MSQEIDICLYIRVSTEDQKLENQILKLKDYARVRDFRIVNVYQDKASGKNTERPGFQKMLKDLETNPQGVAGVLIYKLDRIGRSLQDLIRISKWLSNKNINLISMTDNIDTTSPAGRLYFHIVGSFAEYERDIIIERTKAGLDRARAEGKTFGAPRKKISINEILRLRAEGVPVSKIAKNMGVSRATIYKNLEWHDDKMEMRRHGETYDALRNPEMDSSGESL